MDSGKLRTNTKIILEGQPYIVVDYNLRQQPRLAAKMITKLRNLLTGATVDKTFTSGENLEEADIELGKAQYLYNTGETYTFMDNDNFEQFEFDKEKLGSQAKFLIDGIDVNVMKRNGNAINVELPPTVTVEITECEPGVKGDTASTANKNAIIETGATIQVPLFIEQGDRIVVNTQTGEYKERAK